MSVSVQKKSLSLKIDEKGNVSQKPHDPDKVRPKVNGLVYAGFLGNVGLSIVIPLAIGIYLGSVYDKKYGSYPKGVLIGIFVGFGLSIATLIRTAISFIRMTKE